MGMHWTPSKQILIANPDAKQNIVVHLVLLRWMVANCFRVTKMHRALQFDQKTYLKALIDTFVSKRSQAKTKVEKEIYNLILISAFGKMSESVRNMSRFDNVPSPIECARIVEDPNFTTFTVIDSNLVLLHRKKRNVVLNKNIAGGSSRLEVSKKLMLPFFYNVCKVQWP
jgi:hypothetical protein